MNTLEMMRMAKQIQRDHKEAPKASPKTGARQKVVAGRFKAGDSLGGKTITGLGKAWIETIRDEDTSAFGLEPGRAHRVSVQYAYF